MTALDERPRNGHTLDIPTTDLENDPPHQESREVTALRARLVDRTAEQGLAHQFTAVDADPVFDQVRSEDEQQADRKVAEKIRKQERAEHKRAGLARVRDRRRQRRQEAWMARAERARLRILDPARALAVDHRRWTYSTVLVFALLAGGVAWMSRTVHHGLVGVDGTWLAYLVEPLASVLLAISLVAQFTARQRGLTAPRGAVWFDTALATASVLLNVVPWGLRYGWDAASLTAHLLVPLLVVGAVLAWHLTSHIYGDALATNKKDTSDITDRLALLRQAVQSGDLPVDVSATQVIKYLRANLPGGIGHDAARRVARSFLGY